MLKTLFTLAWPIILARSAQSVIGFSDALMSASLGQSALAAVTTGGLNFFAMVIFPMGLAYILQSFAAQFKGKGDLAAARRYGHYGLMLSSLFLLLGFAAPLGVDRFLSWFPYEANVREPMRAYLVIRFTSLGAVVATEVLGNWFGGLGNTRLQMIASVVAMVVNVLLNYALIGGHWGAPALGVAGAAWASSIATWCGVAVLLWAFVTRRMTGKIEGPLRLRASEFWRMLRFGVPHGFNWFLEFTAFWIFITVVIAKLGTTVLAAFMVVMQINSVSFMPAFGLSCAGAILAGQAIGENHKDKVPGVLKHTLIITCLWQGSVGLIYLALPRYLISLFAPDGQDAAELIRVGRTMLAISACWQLFDAVVISLSEILRSAGDTAWCLWARVVLAWLTFMPVAYYVVSVRHQGYVAAMMCLMGYLVLLAIAFSWRFRAGAWRRIDLTGSHELPI
ncbi:MAG: MATE family efflux transporter [Deltaproteobacteria bacterium]|nr:MATE family efflux transporter [Deltaproteobacteria bacterium]